MSEHDPISGAANLYDPERQWFPIFRALAEPLPPEAIVTYESRSGKQLRKPMPRAVMNRLDDVVGPMNWETEYTSPTPDTAICRLKIAFPDGQMVVKSGAGGAPFPGDTPGDTLKAACMDALCLAAVAFGVGRELYREGTSQVAGGQRPEPRQAPPPARDERGSYEDARPAQRPDDRREPDRPPVRGYTHDEPRDRGQRGDDRRDGGGQGNGQGGRKFDGPPKTGKALFAWCKDREAEHDTALIKYINGWAQLQDFPSRMVDWDADQTAQAFAEARRKLDSLVHAGAN